MMMATTAHGPVSSYMVHTNILSSCHELSRTLLVNSNPSSWPTGACWSPDMHVREDTRAGTALHWRPQPPGRKLFNRHSALLNLLQYQMDLKDKDSPLKMKRWWKEGSVAKTCERSNWEERWEGRRRDQVVMEGSFCAAGHQEGLPPSFPKEVHMENRQEFCKTFPEGSRSTVSFFQHSLNLSELLMQKDHEFYRSELHAHYQVFHTTPTQM
ncbi:uncharacterized protein LOC123861295 isoform X2 [Mirounga angustirostris]|uniref:uncharacterized protein LOC118003032 n=1 Tax=Mirounga leonina TaxID=9715 RepID=UPI00156C5906|nr:uncharacterized protein LOC118003032 [Mirounga leonina]XP_045756218.1 uncharacterized protein LOC123861295 isoform X2 [Mirounga angustirostris]